MTEQQDHQLNKEDIIQRLGDFIEMVAGIPNRGVQEAILSEMAVEELDSEEDAGYFGDVFILDGVDYQKVDMDGLDLDDDTNYIEVFPQHQDLVASGLTLENMLTQMGMTLTEDGLRYWRLPEEYYLAPDNGGVEYTYFKSNPTNTTTNPFKEEALQTGEMDYSEWVTVEEILENLRNTKPQSALQEMSPELLSDKLTKAIKRPSQYLGYTIKDTKDQGVSIVGAHMFLRIEGTTGVWSICFRGIYPDEFNIGDYIEYTTKYIGDEVFSLSTVKQLTQDEWDELLLG